MCQPKATSVPTSVAALAPPPDTAVTQEGGVTEAIPHLNATDNATGVRRKGKEKDKEKSVHVEDGKPSEKEKVRKGRAASPSLSPSPQVAPSIKGALLSLLLKGKGLGIEVDRELAIIVDTLAAIERWDTQTSSALLSLDSLQLQPLVARYRVLLDTVAPKIEREVEIEDGDRIRDGVSGASLSGPGYVESPSFSCTEGFSKPIDGASTSSGPSVDLRVDCALGVERESALWRCVLRFDIDIQQLANQAAELGIRPGDQGNGEGGGALASASFMQLLLCQATIQWMGEARKLLYFPSSPPGTPLQPARSLVSLASDRETVAAHSMSVTDSDVPGEKRKNQRKSKGESQLPETSATAAAAPTDPVQPLSPPVSSSLYWGDCSRY